MRPLEEEWKKYRKKKMKPWYIGSIIFVVLLFMTVFFSDNSKINFNVLSVYFNTLKSSVSSKEVKNKNVEHAKSDIVVNAPLLRIEVEKQAIDAPDTLEDTPANILVDIPILDGKQEAHVIAMACIEPPVGHSHWALRLLANKIVELGYVESISPETVRQTLKKTNSSPGRNASGASRR